MTDKINDGRTMIAVPYEDFIELSKNKLDRRTYIATAALQGLLSAQGMPVISQPDADLIVMNSVRFADALIKELGE